jgi:ribosomal subunit interface protein
MGNVTAKNYELTENEKSLIELKNVRIMACLPRHAKKSAKIEVNVEQSAKGAKKIEAEIIVSVPGKQLVASSKADDLASAFEVAENKIKGQIRKFKDERDHKVSLRRWVRRRRAKKEAAEAAVRAEE